MSLTGRSDMVRFNLPETTNQPSQQKLTSIHDKLHKCPHTLNYIHQE